MRIAQLVIENFRGVRSATLTDAEQRGLVVFSGRNGVGKSVCMLAIAFAWENNEIPMIEQHVGPWNSNSLVEIMLHLSDREREEMSKFHERRSGRPSDDAPPEFISMGHTFDDTGAHTIVASSKKWVAILRDKTFRQRHAFARIDFIPAERSMNRDAGNSIDLRALATGRADDLRSAALESTLGNSEFNMYGVADYLATLDYLDLMRDRLQSPRDTSDYNAISDSFFAATGKRIERPSIASDDAISIFVNASQGNRHSLPYLSSGERETLALMYLVGRLEARGGILLVDEPEMHLHPALQTAILNMLGDANSRAQLWLCTHSPALIAASDPDALVAVSPPTEVPGSQIAWVSNEDERTAALADLGMIPSAWLQADFILVVEGVGDKNLLTALLPAELNRAVVYVAGSKSAVRAVARTLNSSPSLLPWLAVVDHDIIDPADNEPPGVFAWSRRMIENLLLDADLLSAAVTSAGGDMDAATADVILREVAGEELEDISRLMVEERLRKRHFASMKADGKNLGEWYDAEIEVAKARRGDLAEVQSSVQAEIEATWVSSWPSLVSGKRVLSKVTSKTPFRSKADLTNALIRAGRNDETLLPADIVKLRERIVELLPATAPEIVGRATEPEASGEQ